MGVRVPIGVFSKMTFLSIKELRRYHELGLLVPAHVRQPSGYRYYDSSQGPVAQVIRRLRRLGMPVESVRAVMQAPDVAARNELIMAHLARMRRQLAQVQDAVASLQALRHGFTRPSALPRHPGRASPGEPPPVRRNRPPA